MNISRFFIDRPVFAAVLSIVVFLAGAIALLQLPVSEYPDVVPPSVVVRATYPGANPKVIAETVSTPLEEQINGAEDMMYMKSRLGRRPGDDDHVPSGHRSEQGPGRRAEPRRSGPVASTV